MLLPNSIGHSWAVWNQNNHGGVVPKSDNGIFLVNVEAFLHEKCEQNGLCNVQCCLGGLMLLSLTTTLGTSMVVKAKIISTKQHSFIYIWNRVAASLAKLVAWISPAGVLWRFLERTEAILLCDYCPEHIKCHQLVKVFTTMLICAKV